ncbi:alpha-ketoglutarate-dependent dioxygenase AlkB [Mesorhizobium sp.]|uniref:alpha-ketoglutarate-dependent dioxygenase AlkB n=1 Tax=Mesorhizobium sp. TaxID=1871066 RepID=UPI000FE992EC|nr:alpha-ketoglutarate-dependent dioxygenase AlkB [Mesorhizobium sp.]RWN59498.1 MAG: alpha-ketoglutarate-dependent dioxygenase AlkB [Mesorhizobium sp.]
MPSLKTRQPQSAGQGDLFRAPDFLAPDFHARDDLPEGFCYRPELITAEEEAELVRQLESLAFQPFDFHGHLANRRVAGFGLRYDFDQRKVVEAPAIPAFLMPLRDKVAAFARLPAEAFVQVLINEYRPGAGIGWHRDKPHFDAVAGVSLLAPCSFRLRRKNGTRWARETVTLEPRSAYLMTGPARTEWEHSIPPVAAHRYSITLRTLHPQRSPRSEAIVR